MAKPKSEYTLKLEAAKKQKILDWTKVLKKDSKINFSLMSGGKYKDPHPDVVLRKLRMSSMGAAYFIIIRNWLEKNGKVANDAYFLYEKLYGKLDYAAYGVIVKSPAFHQPWMYDAATGHGQYVTLRIEGTKDGKTPLDYVLGQLIANKAVALTMPDDLGICKVYAHKKSAYGRMLMKDKIPSDGLIRTNMDQAQDWPVLVQYIEATGVNVDKQAVCDIVKSVIRHKAMQAEKKVVNDACNVVED